MLGCLNEKTVTFFRVKPLKSAECTLLQKTAVPGYARKHQTFEPALAKGKIEDGQNPYAIKTNIYIIATSLSTYSNYFEQFEIYVYDIYLWRDGRLTMNRLQYVQHISHITARDQKHLFSIKQQRR